MDELDVGLKISVTGALRDEALAACARQLCAWDVAMPAVDPLVLDFGLGDFYQTGLIEYWVANELEAGYFADPRIPIGGNYQETLSFRACEGAESARRRGAGAAISNFFCRRFPEIPRKLGMTGMDGFSAESSFKS